MECLQGATLHHGPQHAASAALFAVLTGYGLVSEDDAARWVQLVAALVPLASLALAWFNTPRTKGKRAK